MPTTARRSGDDSRSERVMIFIDGSNLYHVLGQNCGRHDLVFGKFVEKLAEGRKLQRTYYYNIRQDPSFNPQASSEQEKFLTTLFETEYLEVRLGVHRRHGDTMVEKGVDVMMATDMVAGAFRDCFDTAVVVSGDGDFFPAIQAVKDLGKHVEVVAFDSNLSPEARYAADRAVILTKSFFTTLWTTRQGSRQRSRIDSSASATKENKQIATQLAARNGHGPTAQPREPQEPRPKQAPQAQPAEGTKSGAPSTTSGDGAKTTTRRRGRRGRGGSSAGKAASSKQEETRSSSEGAPEPAESSEKQPPQPTGPRRRLVSVTGSRDRRSGEEQEGDGENGAGRSTGWRVRRLIRRASGGATDGEGAETPNEE